MPELPEVETVRKVLVSWVKGKTINKVISLYPNILANTDVETFSKAITGKKIDDIDRFGKFLVFRIGQTVVLSHLRMEGKYYLAHYPGSKYKEGIEYNPTGDDYHFNKHVHFIFEMNDGSLLLYHDVRKFGRFYLFNEDNYLKDKDSPLSKLGKEPFELKDGEYLYNKTRKVNKTLKETLLDQSILVGLGNIYVDEVCFEAGLSPHKAAKTLTLDECALLTEKAKDVLNKAIDLGGSTIRSYHFANDASGRFQNELNVYGREGEPCPRCGTPITKTKIGGRGTHFCPHCQRQNLKQKIRVIGITGLIGSGKSSVCQIFAENGYQVIDADEISRHSLDKDSSCYQEVVKHFGEGILKADGSINRAKLRAIVVKDEKEVEYLNQVIHPYVYKRSAQAIQSDGLFLLDVPLLFEANMDKLCDLVIFVNTKENIRKQRLIERNTMSLKEASKLNGDPKEIARKIAKATVVIDNSASLDKVRFQVLELLKEINRINSQVTV